MKHLVSHLVLAVITLAAFFGAACTKQVPEAQNANPSPQQSTLPEGHPPLGDSARETLMAAPVANGTDQISWETPTGWIEEPPANAMRQAQYLVPGEGGDGQCVVFYFGAGQGGDAQANAERWADQFSQPDGSSSRDALETEELEVGGVPVLLVQVTGTYNEGGMMMTGAPAKTKPDYMLMGAVVAGPDANWFFKLTGPEETVRSNEQGFRGLLGSIKSPV